MDIELWSCTIFWSKMALLHKLIFVRNTINIILMYFLVRFIMQNFKKIHGMDQELRGCTILGPKWPSCAKWEFFQKNHYYNFHVTLGSFHLAKFQKKSLDGIQSHEDAPFLGPKWPVCPRKRIFSENALANLTAFIHVYLQTKGQSQMSLHLWDIDD